MVVNTFYKSTGPANGNASKLVQRVPSIYSLFNVGYKTGRDYRVLPLIFFGTVRLFRIFCRQRVPLQFFDILQQTEVSKCPKGLPFLLFRHYETVSNFSFFFLFRIFLSLKSPFVFFDILEQTGFSKSRKGPPFCNFKNFALFEP